VNKDFLSIGEMAGVSGLTVKALRFYDKIGLLQPHHTDSATSYRYYSKEQVLQADIIKAARSMDISPNDIKSLFKSRDNNALLDFIDRQKRDAEQKILGLRRINAMADSIKGAIENACMAISNRDVYTREIPQRRIATSGLDGNTDERYVLSKYTELARAIEENNLTDLHETGVIFAKSTNCEFHADRIFNTVADDCQSDIPRLELIPAGRFVCVCYNKVNAEVQQAKLNSYFNSNKQEPILIIQTDLINDIFDYSNPYFELQVLL
jgi:DNA-binding transcriptional MerR regulator